MENHSRLAACTDNPIAPYLLPEWTARLTNSPAAFQFVDFQVAKPAAPFAWKRTRHSANLPWPPPGATLSLTFRGPDEATRDIAITVHHELYDGLPVLGKWITVSNGTSRTITLDRLATERIAAVEAEAAVDERPGMAWRTPAITVLSDYMFKGMDVVTGNQVGSWREDPAFKTQVSYALKTPCVLVCEPPIGPGVPLQPGALSPHSAPGWSFMIRPTANGRACSSVMRIERWRRGPRRVPS